MATTTQSQSRSSGSKSNGNKSRSSERSAFSWGNQTTAIVGAAVAGAAVGFAANMGRKMLMQAPTMMAGNWDEARAAEHKATMLLFDQLEATSNDAVHTRTALFLKIKWSLNKHAVQEENVIYPAMREHNEATDADELNSEHGYVKTYLFELETMAKDSPEFLARVRDFRNLLEEHIREEENRIFPALRAKLSEEENAALTAMMNKEGLNRA